MPVFFFSLNFSIRHCRRHQDVPGNLTGRPAVNHAARQTARPEEGEEGAGRMEEKQGKGWPKLIASANRRHGSVDVTQSDIHHRHWRHVYLIVRRELRVNA